LNIRNTIGLSAKAELLSFKDPNLAKPFSLTDTSRFCPDKFAKDFFVPKKQKHEMRLTNGLAKNRRTEVLSAFVSLFCFGSGGRIKI